MEISNLSPRALLRSEIPRNFPRKKVQESSREASLLEDHAKYKKDIFNYNVAMPPKKVETLTRCSRCQFAFKIKYRHKCSFRAICKHWSKWLKCHSLTLFVL
jgi:hypothetical protein